MVSSLGGRKDPPHPLGAVAAGFVRVDRGRSVVPCWPHPPPPAVHLLLSRLQFAPLGAQHLGDLGKGQVRVARADLLAPLIQEAHVASDRCFGTVRQDLLPLLALGPATLLHRLQNRAAPLEGVWGGALEDVGGA